MVIYTIYIVVIYTILYHCIPYIYILYILLVGGSNSTNVPSPFSHIIKAPAAQAVTAVKDSASCRASHVRESGPAVKSVPNTGNNGK